MLAEKRKKACVNAPVEGALGVRDGQLSVTARQRVPVSNNPNECKYTRKLSIWRGKHTFNVQEALPGMYSE